MGYLQKKLQAVIMTINNVALLLADITVDTATATIDITGLNIGKDDEIMLVGTIVNSTGVEINYSMYFNDNNTSTNYYSQVLIADGTSVNSVRTNNSILVDVSSGANGFLNSKIKLTNSGYGIFQSDTLRELNSSISSRNWYGVTTFTMTSITKIRVVANYANGIGVGSRFQLYKIGGV